MSNEFRGIGASDRTAYVILENSAGAVWNGSAFVTYATADRANYDIAATQQGTASGRFFASFPTAITTSGTYEWTMYQYQDGGVAPAEGDIYISGGSVDWTGSSSVSVSATGGMSGSDFYDYVIRTFKRTDKNTETYEAITDAIQEFRRRFSFDEATEDVTTTDTIASLGDYRLNIESDMGLLQGIILQDDGDGTPLIRVPKSHFDDMYPDIAVTSDRGYPKHFTIYDGKIYLGPIPDSTDYTYRISYSQRAGTVTSSTLSVPFTDLYREPLKHAVLFRLNEVIEDFNKANYYKGLYESEFEQMKSREKRNRGEGFFVSKAWMA